MCAFDTTEADVDAFIAAIHEELAREGLASEVTGAAAP
jgi:hypothetical protein